VVSANPRVIGFQWYDGKQYSLVDCAPEDYAAREAERMDALCALEFRAAKAEAELAVKGGEWCAQNRAEGRGGCGACAWCCKQQRDRAEKAEAERDALKELLREARNALEVLRATDMILGKIPMDLAERIDAALAVKGETE
jgi:hypothetical protein